MITSELVPPRGADAAAVRAVGGRAGIRERPQHHRPAARAPAHVRARRLGDRRRGRSRADPADDLPRPQPARPRRRRARRGGNRRRRRPAALGRSAARGGAGASVYDVDAAGLVQLLVDLGRGVLPDGSELDGPPPRLLVGAAASPGYTPPATARGQDRRRSDVRADPGGARRRPVRGVGRRHARGLRARRRCAPAKRHRARVGAVGRDGARVRGAGRGGVSSERAAAGEGEEVAREVVSRLVQIPEVRGLHVLAIGSGTAAAARLAAYAREVAGV